MLGKGELMEIGHLSKKAMDFFNKMLSFKAFERL